MSFACDNRRRSVWLGRATIIAIVTCLIGALALLYTFNPAGSSYYPPCLLRKLTGISCPGCGTLRATHQLLHGHLRAALVLNPLLVLMLPLMAFWIFRGMTFVWRGEPIPSTWLSLRATYWLLAVVVCFGIARNLITFVP